MKETSAVYVPTQATPVSEAELGMKRQVLAYNQKMMLVRHQFQKGWKGAPHSLPHEQLVYVVTGKILFECDGKTYELSSGDSIVIEGNTRHQATALETAEALDIFVPYREDYAEIQ
jgi:quercetin dioxygenase-like cupin family protein